MGAINPNDIKWRIGSTNRDKTKGMLLGYIDAREAMEHLDELDPGWSDTYTIVNVDGHQGVQCALTVNGVTRTDVGVPSNTEGVKGAYSDALKRAAVKHNIGRELYELPTIWVEINDRGYPIDEPVFKDGAWVLKQGKGYIIREEQAAPDMNAPAKPAQAPQAPSTPKGDRRVTDKQLNRMWAISHGKGMETQKVRDYISSYVDRPQDLTMEQYDEVVAWIEEHGAPVSTPDDLPW